MLDTLLNGFLNGFILGSVVIWLVIFCDHIAGQALADWDAQTPATATEEPAVEAEESAIEKVVEKETVEEAVVEEQAIEPEQVEEVPAPAENVGIEDMSLPELKEMGRLYAIKNWHCMGEKRLRVELGRVLAAA